MANVKISQLPSVNPVDATTVFLVSSNYTGTLASYKATVANLANAVLSNIGSNSNVSITQNGNVSITSNGSSTWTFDTGGNLNIPGGSKITNNSGGIQIIANANGTVRISSNNDQSWWIFKETGELQLALSNNSGISGGHVAALGNIILNASNTLYQFGLNGNLTLPANTFSINFANGSQASAPLVDILNTNGLTTTYYPTFVENRTNGQIIRADVDLTYRTDTNTLTVGNISITGGINVTGTLTAANIYANSGTIGASLLTGTLTTNAQPNVTSVGTLTSLSVTGNLSAGNVNSNVNGFAIGYRDVPQVSASNTTLAATDAGKHYYSTTAGNITLTIPNNATTSFSTGTAISIVVQAAGNVLVNAASGVTLYMAGNSTAGNRIVGTYGMATLLKVASDTWFINGTGVS